ncbi:hypothetical protein GUJ93_ZPchr0006g42248 [Zizania palustris]|uniref:Uncharacterized protein n=1 Tax=Zizania palustris TaxID=103762 RepID=A0A8J5SNA1_ZIZPA|nr:hypothetical protein GUJ93_ZPchr0006g42248 [Zizania palustris]
MATAGSARPQPDPHGQCRIRAAGAGSALMVPDLRCRRQIDDEYCVRRPCILEPRSYRWLAVRWRKWDENDCGRDKKESRGGENGMGMGAWIEILVNCRWQGIRIIRYKSFSFQISINFLPNAEYIGEGIVLKGS